MRLDSLWIFATAFAAICGAGLPNAAATKPPVIAVFELEDRRDKPKTKLATTLTELLRVELAASGRYRIVPRADMQAALRSQKKASFKECYDEACQIEIGKELAAEKSISPKISQIGSVCLVTLSIFDLRSSTAERASKGQGPCTEEAILASTQSAIAKLHSGSAPRSAVVGTAAATPAERPPQDMVAVQAGTFFMGCNAGIDLNCSADEKPNKIVRTERFMIDKTEVTVEDFRACVKAGACSQEKLNMARTIDGRAEKKKLCNWSDPKRGRHPMNCVSVKQAEAFCQWKGKRLPTEAEWEKAARGKDGRLHPWGNSPMTCSMAIFNGKLQGCSRTHTWPVGAKPAGRSPYGAFDMLGNVAELTADTYTFGQGASARPKRIIKGGSFASPPRSTRCSAKDQTHLEYGSAYWGFRCAK